MKKYLSLIAFLLMGIMTISLSSCSSDDDELNASQDDDVLNALQDYDIIQINGISYACYGHRCLATYKSSWDLYSHCGHLSLPCGNLSDAQKGEYDYDYYYRINLDGGNRDLKKGSKLEDFDPTFENPGDYWGDYDYVSGSATITDKKDDEYVTVEFNNFKFAKESKSYVLNGTVQLSFDED